VTNLQEKTAFPKVNYLNGRQELGDKNQYDCLF